ncbi:MAG: GGDEF domain-containing protein [Burkholderiales bacterium]
MMEAEERLDGALRAASADGRARRQRQRWIGAIAASYATDALFLGLFAVIGTIPALIPAVYGAAAAMVCLIAWLVYARGWNLHLRDPNMTEPLILFAIVMQLGVAVAAPRVAFPFLANLFTVFAFGMVWLTLAKAVAAWTVGVFGAGIAFYLAGSRFAVPTGSLVEVFLAWLYFSLILGRCLLVSVAANEMRTRLAESRRQLADTLDQVQRLASHDELTRALNRRALVSSLERERMRAERSGLPFAIGMMDLDHFKRVNDSHGHAVGDAVLREFSAIVHDTMRATDVFGRYGGEEFLIILVGTELPAALEAIERIRAAVQSHDWSALAPGLTQTVSAGVASFSKGQSIEQLLYGADQALYQAKHGGRNRVIARNP